MDNEMLLWQLADSAFPSGAFAHSAALEANWQLGALTADGLSDWLEAQLAQAARGLLPFVRAAHEGKESWADVDRECDLFLNNHVANRASRAQGQAFAVAVRTIDDDLSRDLRRRARDGPFHLAPVFGLAARELVLEASQATRLFLFTTLRGWVSAAVRLGAVGPLEGQAIQFHLLPRAAALAEREAASIADVAQTAPLADLLQAGHDRLYSRLFQS